MVLAVLVPAGGGVGGAGVVLLPSSPLISAFSSLVESTSWATKFEAVGFTEQSNANEMMNW